MVASLSAELGTKRDPTGASTGKQPSLGEVTGAAAAADNWWLRGPFHLPSSRWSNIPMFMDTSRHLARVGRYTVATSREAAHAYWHGV